MKGVGYVGMKFREMILSRWKEKLENASDAILNQVWIWMMKTTHNTRKHKNVKGISHEVEDMLTLIQSKEIISFTVTRKLYFNKNVSGEIGNAVHFARGLLQNECAINFMDEISFSMYNVCQFKRFEKTYETLSAIVTAFGLQ